MLDCIIPSTYFPAFVLSSNFSESCLSRLSVRFHCISYCTGWKWLYAATVLCSQLKLCECWSVILPTCIVMHVYLFSRCCTWHYRFSELESFVHNSLLRIKPDLLPVMSHLGVSPKDILLSEPVVTHTSTALMLIWGVVVDILQNSSLEVRTALKTIWCHYILD